MIASETFNNVNFQILLKQHGGNFERAEAAWRAICGLGGFGNVPITYEGGLDLKGARIARDEMDHDGPIAHEMDRRYLGRRPAQPVSQDDIKRIEDLASGDRPN